eukprot:CAMPEP_0184976590 /NCGR_PEP_ID=MMETSP1098-20130426/7509_1 /TAXON_ID=89044 /ORGANISM="Spumella elongata, Strain CCAP 955/1" /LENGTH=736 /DNA_ID=CAMNT_0027499491 /DNA_START=10 /DNA_END=2220 /DNA_ORIENTATION=+
MNQLIVQFEQTHIFSFDGLPSGRDIKNKLFEEEGVPAELITLSSDDRNLSDNDLVNNDDTLIIRASLLSGLCGGKGGFGAQLRALAKQKAYRKTTDFGACRDLSGRRLRHVNDEILLQKWQEAKDKGEAFEPDGETPTGIDLWFLSAPSWAEGVKVDKRKIFMKPRMKTSMCIDWKRARENRPAPDGAPAHWGCPRGRRCEFAHGVEELRGDAQKALLDAKQQEKWDAINKKKDDYMGVLYRSHKEEEEVEDLVLAGLRAAKRAKLNALAGSGDAAVSETSADKKDAEMGDDANSVHSSAVGGESEEEEMSLDYFTALSGTVVVAKAKNDNISTSSAGTAVDVSASRVCPVITGTSAFATVVVDAVDLALNAGKGTSSVYYYEVELQSDGLMQLGWVDSHFIANFHSAQAAATINNDTNTATSSTESVNTVEADGVGDDVHSWGFDGYRQQKWHAGEGCAYGPQTGNIWQIGDTVGCYLELFNSSNVADNSEIGADTKSSKDRKRKAETAAVATTTIGSISYTLNGVNYGKAFDITAPVDSLSSLRLFPAMSLENNESVLLNLGSKNFKYAPSDGYTMGSESVKKATPAKGKKSSASAAVEGDSKVSVGQIVSVWEALLHPTTVNDSLESTKNDTTNVGTSSTATEPSTAVATAAPAAAPGATPAVEETHAPINLDDALYTDVSALEELGLVHLKQELQLRGMKTGGTLQERAKRLHSVRGVPLDKIDPKLLAKKP